MLVSLSQNCMNTLPLRKRCPYSKFFWSVLSCMRTEYGEIRSISPCSVQMRENKDQKNSEYGHFLRSVPYRDYVIICRKMSKIIHGVMIFNNNVIIAYHILNSNTYLWVQKSYMDQTLNVLSNMQGFFRTCNQTGKFPAIFSKKLH